MPGLTIPPVAPTSVTCEIDYLDPALKEKPFSWLGNPPEGAEATNIEPYPCSVTITDLRSVEGYKQSFTTDTSGFQVVDLESGVSDFDSKDGQQAYFKEVEQMLLATLPKATRVVVFNHTIRRKKHNAPADPALGRTPGNTGPVSRAHNDNTPATGLRRVELEMGGEAEELKKGRCQIVNVWKPLAYEAIDSPLAYVDYRTVDWEKDLVPTDLILSNEGARRGENFSVLHSSAHKWYYLSAQKPSEAIVFKIYDSVVEDDVARLTVHSAFVNPLAPEDCLPRQSIEVRCLVFY